MGAHASTKAARVRRRTRGLVRGILGGVLYGGLLLGAGLLDPRSYALGDIKLCAGLGVWLGGNSWASLYIGILTAQVLQVLIGCIVWAWRLTCLLVSDSCC